MLKRVSWLVCLLLVLLNILLLHRLTTLKDVNVALSHKVTPSLNQQFWLYEHKMEGLNVARLVARMRQSSVRFAQLYSAPSKLKLLFFFPGANCRRSLHMEARLFHEFRGTPVAKEIPTAMVFAEFSPDDFTTLARQFEIEDVALLDRENLVGKELGARVNPLILLLDSRDEVVYAKVSLPSDEAGGRRMYQKIAASSTWLKQAVHEEDPPR